MKLNITKSERAGEIHKGPLFPGTEDRHYAYQNESVRIEAVFHAWGPRRGDGKENWSLPKDVHSQYALHISRATGKAFEFRLIATRADIVEQRRANGVAVVEDAVITTLSFGELCNLLFSAGAQVYHEEERYPESVKAAMREAYPRARVENNSVVRTPLAPESNH